MGQRIVEKYAMQCNVEKGVVEIKPPGMLLTTDAADGIRSHWTTSSNSSHGIDTVWLYDTHSKLSCLRM